MKDQLSSTQERHEVMDEARDTLPEDSPTNMALERNFHHPYTPYNIQKTFMETVYEVLEQGKVGILESPTGTVSISKSLQYMHS